MKIVDKPWGQELILEHNPKYVLKKIFVKAGHAPSLQYHEYKKETLYVLSGKLKFEVGPDVSNLQVLDLNPGDFYTLEPLTVHRMNAEEDTWFLEASTSELDDVVRLKDHYGRK